ncbi:LLM class flavin-dependent oxidoreductase [Gordonia humi]|uniref:LLM class flavin-dependent oxidoreductase n=1 Tax=Gordonia humi TaxID=686429 RepID=UPI0036239DE0
MRAAAELGVGAIVGGFYLGFEFIENMLRIYDDALAGATHTYPLQAEKIVAVAGGMHCADTRDEALRWARSLTDTVALSTDAYQRLAKLSSDYQYMGAVKDVDFTDENYMFNDSAGFIVGDPDDCVAQVQRFADLGGRLVGDENRRASTRGTHEVYRNVRQVRDPEVQEPSRGGS